jgi:hypothetical protein
MKSLFYLLLVVLVPLLASGCSATRPRWFFPDKPERTSYRTASMRMDAVRDIERQANGLDSPEQREITDQLARQIQIEPDPLVREAIVEALSEFKTPLAKQVLQAGLADSDIEVRRKCCVALGERGETDSVTMLAEVIKGDEEHEVRIAAVDALGKIKSPESVKALAVALEDGDPAMQYAGVSSMKAISGRDYGGDVSLWLEYARNGDAPMPEKSQISVAERVKSLSPF